MKRLVLKLTGIFVLVFVASFVFLNLLPNKVINIKAENEPTTPSLEILKNNVSYSESIYIAYAVACEGFEYNKEEVQLLFWNKPQDTYLKGTENVVGTEKGKTNISGQKCQVFYSEGLAAKHMTDDLIARAYVQIEGVDYYSEPLKFSVLEYVYKMKDAGSLNPHQKRLLETLLSYGGAAQNNFGHNTDRLADSQYFRIELINGKHEDGFAHGLFQKDEVLTITANEPEEGYKFSHWEDSKGNIISDKAVCEVTVKEQNETYEAIYKELSTIILKDNLSIDEPFDATAQTLSLPDFITVNNALDEEETIEVTWDTTTFIPGQIGEQIIYGSLVESDYVLEKPLAIKVNIFPYTFIYDEDNDTYAINKYYGTSAKEVIPSTFKNKDVTVIKAYAFDTVLTLTELEIPSTIKEIENGAIYLCDNIEKITIPFVGKKFINSNYEEGAFGYIFGASSYLENQSYVPPKLKEVTILEGITSITTHAFDDCITLKKINLPESLETIGTYSFNNCTGLESIVIPNAVKTIDTYAFYRCSSLKDVTLFGNSAKFTWYVFEECISLQNVYFNGSITDWCNIEFEEATYNNTSSPMNYAKHFYMLNEEKIYEEVTEIVIPEEVTEIGYAQFCGFENVTSITLPNTITLINDYGFYNCVKLTEFIVPNNVSTIGDYAFSGCIKLETITLNSNRLTEIGNYAFEKCPFKGIDLPNTIVTIGNGAFYECIYLENLIIPSGVTNIGDTTFFNCYNLKTLDLPDTIYNIGMYAFYNCSEITTLHLSNSLLSIGDWAFQDCIKLVNINLPASLESIGMYAFMNCSSLASAVVPENITSLVGTFYGCENLMTVTLPSNLITIGDSAFRFCRKLENIIIPDSVKIIEALAFNECTNLNNVTFPEGLETIGEFSFQFCEDFTSIVIPNKITIIENSTFSGCTKLSEVVLPDSITSIGSEAFTNTQIKEINLTNVETIGRAAFRFSNLEYVILGEKLQLIGEDAFNYCSNLSIVYNLSNLELTIGSTDHGCVALNAKYIHNELPREILLQKDVEYGKTVDTLGLPETVTFMYNEEEISLNVNWDTTSFVEGQYGEQVINGSFEEDELYDKYNIKRGAIKFIINAIPYKLSLSSGTYQIDYYYGSEEEVIIPSSFNGVNITALGPCFSSNKTIKSVVIPSTIRKINESAFYYCENLDTITVDENNPVFNSNNDCNAVINTSTNELIVGTNTTVIPEGVVSIGRYAFAGRVNLNNIILPNTVKSIGVAAFRKCTGLESFTMSSEIETINDYAFEYVTCEINWNDATITKIDDYAFYYYKGESIAIPNTVTTIGQSSFEYCDNLTSIVIPDGVTSIDSYAFKYCSKLTSIEVPNSVTTIGSGAFAYCSSLTELIIPFVGQCDNQSYNNNFGYIFGASSYENNNSYVPSSLTKVTITGGTTISQFAFYNCPSLTKVFIPSSVTAIGKRAFYGCANLKIYCEISSTPTGWVNEWNLKQSSYTSFLPVYGYSLEEFKEL